MCVYMCVCIHESRCLQRPEEGIRSPRAGFTSGCHLPDVGSGGWTWVGCNGNMLLELPSHLSSLIRLNFCGFLLNLKIMANGTLTGQCTSGSLLSLPPTLNELHIPRFYTGFEVQIPGPRIEWQTLYWLSHPSSPSSICRNRQQREENSRNPTGFTRAQEERPWVEDSLPWTSSWKQSLEINLPRETSKVSKVRDTCREGMWGRGEGGEVR